MRLSEFLAAYPDLDCEIPVAGTSGSEIPTDLVVFVRSVEIDDSGSVHDGLDWSMPDRTSQMTALGMLTMGTKLFVQELLSDDDD